MSSTADEAPLQSRQYALLGHIGILAFWLASALPLGGMGLMAGILAIIMPLAYPKQSPLLLFTSFLFYSTINIPADYLYALRAYWIAIGFTYFVLFEQRRFPMSVWATWTAALVLVAYGLLIGLARTPEFFDSYRSAPLEAMLAVLWISCLFIGYSWCRLNNAVFGPQTLYAMMIAWVISVGYGVAQTIFGLNESTVPPDVLPQIIGVQQYDELGRRPFSFLTANGPCVAALMVLPILLDRKKPNPVWIGSAFFIAIIVAALTLTRSYMLLLSILFLAYGVIYSRKMLLTVSFWIVGVVGTAITLSNVEVEVITSAIRLSNASIDSTRLDIWSYALQQMSAIDWIAGHGFGSNGWYDFFASWKSSKILLSPHSAMLEITGQFGVLGTVAYLGILLFVLVSFVHLRRSSIGPGVAVAIGLITLREQVSASYILSPSLLSGMFWLLIGILLAQYDSLAESRRAPLD